ncbi:MAG TPA: molybdopterin cofactor-binding domain-containing protein [Stellaceae bacterium]|nr:molybdopterin cofactor-binding domain-containing protein [Stellaceae bacterium]
MSAIVKPSRRDLLRGAAALSGLVLGFHVGVRRFPVAASAASNDNFVPNVWLAIDETGGVTIIAHRSEMGTGIKTGLPAVLADELEADWTRVKVVQATGDAKYGDQNTDGSRSVRQFYLPMRQAGAAARQMLEAAAARLWQVPVAECHARNHVVVHAPSGRQLGFGALVETAASLPVPPPSELRLKPASARRYIGHSLPIVDLNDIVRGAASYGIDTVLPEMKYASIERCPVYGGRARSYDAAAALKVRGVERVIEIPATPIPSGFEPLGGVAVIAGNTWSAQQGRNQLKIDWDLGPNRSYDSDAYRAQLEQTAKQPGHVVRQKGDVDGALAAAPRRIAADYFVPYYAHSPMEVPVAVARVVGDRCECWAPTQNPQGARSIVAKVLGIPEANVTINVTLLGGGFGRKSKPDFIAEAAFLSRAIGAPVKVTWTREDEIRHDYYHAISAQHLEAALDPNGRATAWLHRTVFPSIQSTFAPNVLYGAPGELGQGVTDMPYDIANIRCENGPAANHVRIGWYRSVYNIPHAFAVCSFADELAAAAGVDPLLYLHELIGLPRLIDLKAEGVDYPNYGASLETYPIDTGRLRRVLDLAAERSGWGGKLPARAGRGIAVHRSFLTYVAAVVQVAVAADGTIAIPRVDVALDAGLVVNPDRVRAQFEGAAIMGISNALYGNLTVRKGRVEQSNFPDCPVARIDIAPVTHVHIVDSDAPPAGVGEPGVPPIAPALCNALFAATGKRIRALPVDPTQLKSV